MPTHRFFTPVLSSPVSPLLLASILGALSLASPAIAEIQTETVEYEHDGQALKGTMVWDDAVDGKVPGILVVHEWWGLNDHARERARQLAEEGYVAFALDMYGEGRSTEHPSEAGQWAGEIRANVDAWRARAAAGLEVLKRHPKVDAERLAAIGFCFGGATVLQMAYSMPELDGVVSFHGSFPVPEEGVTGEDHARILVCHGSADGFSSAEQITAFREALDAAGFDWEMVLYSGAEHSFTNRSADDRGIDGLGYDAEADERSWRQMMLLFHDLFG